MRTIYDSITDFIFMEDKVTSVDAILVAGASSEELARKAARLHIDGYAPYIVVSGGHNKKLEADMTECEFLSNILIDEGVEEESIIKESSAKNTFENARFSLKLLEERGISTDKLIIVSKAYHSRRAFMTYKAVFPKMTQFCMQTVVASRAISKENWHMNSEKIKCVMEEVRKIGTYFPTYLIDILDTSRE